MTLTKHLEFPKILCYVCYVYYGIQIHLRLYIFSGIGQHEIGCRYCFVYDAMSILKIKNEHNGSILVYCTNNHCNAQNLAMVNLNACSV